MGPALGRVLQGLRNLDRAARETSGQSWLGPSTPGPTPGQCPGKEGRGQGAVGSVLGAGPSPTRPPAPGEAGSRSGVPPARHPPGGGENVPAVGANGVDGAVMAFDLADGREVVHVPDLDDARTAGAQQHGAAGDKGQCAHPVLVCSGDLLGKERAVRAGSGDPDLGTLEPPGGGGRGAGSITGPGDGAFSPAPLNSPPVLRRVG